MVRPPEPATVADCLYVQGDLRDHEIRTTIDRWAKLDARLRSFRSGSIELHLWVKDRETPSQHVTLEARRAGMSSLVATSSHANLTIALNQVRDEMIRQLGDAKHRTEPRHNRRLRPAH
jgi:ribosome-associated translation inhibitor RaiA